MSELTGWYWAIDWITADALVADPTNDLGMFPVQSDQPIGIDWQRPGNESDRVEDQGEIVKATNGFSFGYGNTTVTWKLRGLRPMMVGWIVAQKFPSGVLSYPATIAIPALRNSGVAAYYQAIASRHEYQDSTPALGGLDEWVIDFVEATPIAPPT